MNKKLQTIIELYKQSAIDTAFSRREKRDVQQAILAAQLDNDEIGYIRRQVFAIAREQMQSVDQYVVLDWLERANHALWLALESSVLTSCKSNVYFSPGSQCQQAILTKIQHASRYLDLCVFTITDNQIADAIIHGHTKGINIRIITDNHKSLDLGSDISRLVNCGISVRIDNTDNHMHHKFAIVDNTSVITGSYNWTRSAFLYNHENILISDDSAAVSSYRQEFDNLWRIMTPYEALQK